MDPFENGISGPVLAPAFPPALDNSLVVAKNFDTMALWELIDECDNEELHPDCFCPANVSAFVFLPWEEPPCSPSIIDPNRNAST
jgi:hypothetical protein